MSITTGRAGWPRVAVLPVLALALVVLTPLPSDAAVSGPAISGAATAAPLAVASPRSTGLAVTLTGNSPMLTPGGEPAEFVATVANSADRELTGVRLSFSTVPATPGTHWFSERDLRVQVAARDGWRLVPLAATASRTAYRGTLSTNPGLTVPAGEARQVRFRLALATTASGVPGPSEFTVEATAADGSLHGAASRDYAARTDPAATPVGDSVSASPSDPSQAARRRRHRLARAGNATGTVAAVVSVAAVLGLGAVAFGLGTRRRRRGEH
jgi:hypothetical protein